MGASRRTWKKNTTGVRQVLLDTLRYTWMHWRLPQSVLRYEYEFLFVRISYSKCCLFFSRNSFKATFPTFHNDVSASNSHNLGMSCVEARSFMLSQLIIFFRKLPLLEKIISIDSETFNYLISGVLIIRRS